MRLIAVLLICLGAAGPAAADCVVLVHGLARGPGSFLVMEQALRRAGFDTVRVGYPSTEAPVEQLSTAIGTGVAACAARGGATHVVTHSMGAILLRHWMGDPAHVIDGRAVLLGPPNEGSELVDKLGDLAPFQWVNGPAGLQLGTDGLPLELGTVTAPFAVIAGTSTLNPITSAMIPGGDDGKVAVRATLLRGASAVRVLPVTHTFMMNDPRVIRHVITFLQTGDFAEPAGWWRATRDVVAGED